jgi:hypothetical protein
MPTRRSTRISHKQGFSEYYGGIYHINGKPETELERLVHALNKQSFPTQRYGEVDDIIVYSMFASKKAPPHRALHLVSALTQNPINLDKQLATSLAVTIFQETSEEDPNPSQCSSAAEKIISSFSDLFTELDKDILAQYVSNS